MSSSAHELHDLGSNGVDISILNVLRSCRISHSKSNRGRNSNDNNVLLVIGTP